MDVRHSYKQTDVGGVLDQWDVAKLGAMCTAVLDCHHSTPVWTKTGAVVIRNQNIRDGKLDFSELSFTDEKHFAERTRRAVPTYGDLVITREAPMGLVCMIPEGLKCCLGQRMVLLRVDREIADTRYLLYALMGEAVQRSISVAGGTGSTVSNLRIPVLKQLQVLLLLPTKAEQRAIADALSDVDALLDALDRLIAKKRNLKQAVMQQLLTGQIRLPGFHGEWNRKRLGDIADTLKGTGLSKGQLSSSGTRPCILYGELFTTYSRVISTVFSRTDSNDGCDSVSGDVLMPGSTTTSGIDLAVASALLADGVALGGDINIIRRRGAAYTPAFLANYLTCVSRKQIAELTQGITIHHLYGRELRSLTLELPSLAEQTAISQVLADMDAELTAFEARRDKTRDLKQAMMQELLTGRTRLV